MPAHDLPPGGSRSPDGDLHDLLRAARDGDPGAVESLFTALFHDLRARAGAMMAGDPGHTLQPTAVVNEAYLRLVGTDSGHFADRQHFLLAASRAMRHILVDHFRARNASHRPGDRRAELEPDGLPAPWAGDSTDLEALDRALQELERTDPTMARFVELRYFGEVGMEEIARVLEIPVRTLNRRWHTLRAWLYQRMR